MARESMQPNFDSGDRLWFRIGSVTFIGGIVLLILANILHPSRANPSDNLAAFAEYAANQPWVITHMLQLFGAMLFMVPGMLAVRISLEHQGSGIRNLAGLGFAVSLVAFSVYAVDMGVDGIALKRAVNAWVAATAADKAVYFAVAEGIRWVENGVLGVSALFQGLAVLLISNAMLPGKVYQKWVGWVGLAGGLGFFMGALLLLVVGFSSAAMISQIAFLAILVWAFAVAFRLWRL